MVRLPDPALSRAVLVGASRYADAGLTDLPAAARNVEALGRLLAAAGPVVVVDPPDVAAVLDSVRTAALQAEDVLLVYFAGHGLLFGASWIYIWRSLVATRTSRGPRCPIRRSPTWSGTVSRP